MRKVGSTKHWQIPYIPIDKIEFDPRKTIAICNTCQVEIHAEWKLCYCNTCGVVLCVYCLWASGGKRCSGCLVRKTSLREVKGTRRTGKRIPPKSFNLHRNTIEGDEEEDDYYDYYYE